MLAADAMKLSQNSFEYNTPSQAYTHGLEQIYALETIDLSTVKKISVSPAASEQSSTSRAFEENERLWDGQLMLSLGDEFLPWISPFFLEEPIQVLHLSRKTEIVCTDQGIRRIKDLLDQDFRDWVMSKRIGQGYIEEIEQKLKEFTGGRSFERAFFVEFASFLRGITVGLERKKIAVLLKSYGLAEYYPLSPFEKMESLNLQNQREADWIHDAKKELSREDIRSYTKAALTRISKTFLLPWIRARGGVVNIHEVLERLERIAQEPELVPKIDKFLQDVCFLDQHPFTFSLFEVADRVYCPDQRSAEWYLKICKTAQSYFYQENTVYELGCLKTLLAKEFSLTWESFPDLFVSLTLKRSPLFRVRKGVSGKLEVRLSQGLIPVL